MTLDEAQALLAQYDEAKRLVKAERRERERTWSKAECDAGRHSWVRNDPRTLMPYCGRCGKEKKP